MRLISVSDVRELVNTIGLGPMLAELAGQIEADYRRWPEFGKSARFVNVGQVRRRIDAAARCRTPK